MKQLSFADVEFSKKPKQTRRERFLLEMEAVVPWARLETVIKPHYPVLPQGWERALTLRAIRHASHPLHAAMVWLR